jgi:hypothetical protein
MLAASLERELGPIRQRAESLRGDRRQVVEALRAGAIRARTIAEATMVDVRRVMGMGTQGWT